MKDIYNESFRLRSISRLKRNITSVRIGRKWGEVWKYIELRKQKRANPYFHHSYHYLFLFISLSIIFIQRCELR